MLLLVMVCLANKNNDRLSTVDRHTQFLDFTALKKVLRSSDFKLSDLKAKPEGVSVYLCFPATRADISKRWMRIFVNQLLDAMEREHTRARSLGRFEERAAL